MAKAKHIFVIDTCVLLHDPECIYRFHEHDIYIPLACIDDLDEIKTKKDTAGWAAREVFRNLDQYDIQSMTKGVVINEKGGKLFIYNNEAPLMRNEKPAITRVNSDNAIIDSAITLKAAHAKRKVVIVSKDTGLRVRAISWGCIAENYKNDLLNDQNQYQGYRIVEIEEMDDWTYLSKRAECNIQKLTCKDKLADINPNEFICFRFGNQSVLCWYTNNEFKFLEDKKKESYMGITARNLEQRFALEALSKDDIPLVCLSGPAGSGKAQPLDSLLLTPSGYITMGEVKVGDKVCGSDGNFYNVTGVFSQGQKDVVKIIFSDGSEVECCKEHLWNTKTELQRNKKSFEQIYTTKSTQEIIDTLAGHDGRKNHSIPVVEPVNFSEKLLEIDPYVLGVLLGDGGISHGTVVVSTKDQQILDLLKERLEKNCEIKKIPNANCDYRIVYNSIKNNILSNKLSNFNLKGTKSNSKFIPQIYKLGSIKQRIELLQGLLDTDGYISKKGSIFFYTVSDQLASDVIEIVNSLGGTVKSTVKFPKYTYKGEVKNGQKCNVLCICLPNNIMPFKLERKMLLVKDRIKYFPARYISDVIEMGQKECQCISVDAPDSLYVTDNFILTHNTLCAIAVGLEKVNLGQYDRIIVMKPMIAVGGKDIGFLPGSKLEKVSAWLGPIKDNIIQLTGFKGYDNGKFGGNSFEEMVEDGIIEVEAMAFIQGRSIPNSFIILDEAENVSPKEARMVIERCGKNSKVVFLGDMSQIENPYLDKHSCGLAHAINGGKTHEVAASINMCKVERSVLSAAASSIFKVRK
jgi:predicted ribonuclease YlaK